MRGSIVKRTAKDGSPLYSVVIRNKWYKVPGKQTLRNAELYRAQLLVELERGGPQFVPNRMTLAELWERWRLARFSDLASDTRGNTEQCIRTMILPYLGSRSVTTITAEDIELWKSALLETYSPRTVETALRRLRSILNDAVKWHHLLHNPAKDVRRPRSRRKEMNFLDRAQILQVLEGAPDLQWKTMILATIVAGLRISEVAACRWRYVDWENCQYYVAERRTYRYGPSKIVEPKTEYSKASVMLTPYCLGLLREHQSSQAERRLRAGIAEDFIFITRKRGPFCPTYLRLRWSQLLVDLGVPHVRFHDLRHTCATLWIDQGESPKFVQKQMRHASINTTYDVYGHLFPETKIQASERFDEALFGKSG